jgi:uncharacterized protein (TIGR02996 family)
MSQERGLLRMIAREPDEDAPRLVYADWLEDHDRGDRAEFIRAQVRLAEVQRLFPPPDRKTLEFIFYGIVDSWVNPGDSPQRRAAAFRAGDCSTRTSWNGWRRPAGWGTNGGGRAASSRRPVSTPPRCGRAARNCSTCIPFGGSS